MLAFRPVSAVSVVSALLAGAHAAANPGPGNTWPDWTLSTVSLSFTHTQYVPVTTTETDTSTTAITKTETSTVTIYQTIISTEILTTTERTTETTPTTEVVTTPTTLFDTITATQFETVTTPTTILQTVTTPTTLFDTVTATQFQTVTTPTTILQTITATTPLTETATEEISVYPSTERLTSLKLCPTRITNPTFTVQASFPTDWTWGCPPGWLCKPKQEDCNFEVGLPDRNFYCAPNECIPAQALPALLPTWDPTPAGNSTPLTNPALTVNAIDDFFNMNPTDFGLTYQIFVVDRVVTLTSTTVIPPAPTLGMRQAQTLIPGACYPWCNNVLLEAQSAGKSPALCRSGSAFETDLSQCLECVAVHAADKVGNFVQIAPQFQQFLDYCNQFSATTVTKTATRRTTTTGATLTTVVPTTSLTTIVSSRSELSTLTPEATSIATLPTTLTSAEEASTYTGSQLSSFTIVMPAGNSTTTMAGSRLSGATIILPGSTSAVITSSVVTTFTLSGPASSGTPTPVVISSQSPSSASSGSAASTFTGAASPVSPQYGSSWLATLLAGLVALF